MDIRVLKVNEVSTENRVNATGFASINRSTSYFWASSTPPKLDITFHESSAEEQNCLNLMKSQEIAPGQAIQIQASGTFQSIDDHGFPIVGIFSLGHLTSCALIDAK